jgi:hypothetical protein
MGRPYKVRLKKSWQVLLLEDSDERADWFKQRIPNLDHAYTSKAAIKALDGKEYDFIFLDHDLGGLGQYADRVIVSQEKEETGTFVAEYLAARGFIGTHVLIHSWNAQGVQRMLAALRHANAIAFGQFEIELED